MTVHEPSNTTRRPSGPDWRHQAACREEDPELFFPVGDSGPAKAQAEEAKWVCSRCPVRVECLDWAMESGQGAGVWGGLSEGERCALRRRAARAPETAVAMEGVRLATTWGTDMRRWMVADRMSPEAVARRLDVGVPVVLAAVRVLDLVEVKLPRPQPRVGRVLAREADLRKLRGDGLTLRQCAPVLGEPYESVRLAWKVLEQRDAEAALGGAPAAVSMELAS